MALLIVARRQPHWDAIARSRCSFLVAQHLRLAGSVRCCTRIATRAHNEPGRRYLLLEQCVTYIVQDQRKPCNVDDAPRTANDGAVKGFTSWVARCAGTDAAVHGWPVVQHVPCVDFCRSYLLTGRSEALVAIAAERTEGARYALHVSR